MIIFIRVDSSKSIGSGHVFRCLCIAEMLTQKQNEVVFLHQNLSGNQISHIEKKGYKVFLLESSFKDNRKRIEDVYDLSEQESDAAQCVRMFEENYQNEIVDWLIVDHYGLDHHWHNILRKYANKIMVIDDLANRNYECDMLVDSNYGEEYRHIEYRKSVPQYCKVLTGLKYQPIRQEFYDVIPKVNQNECKNVLVFMGGGDASDVTQTLLKIIIDLKNEDILTTFIIGNNYVNKDALIEDSSRYSHIRVIEQTESFANILANIDLLICAGGGVLYEAGILGVPVVTIYTSENQKVQAENLHRDGYIHNLGAIRKINNNHIKNLYEALTNDWTKFFQLGQELKSLFSESKYSCSHIYNEMINLDNSNNLREIL